MKILVLGSSGKLGAYATMALYRAGHEVIACGRRTSDNGFYAAKGITYIGGFVLEARASYDKLPSGINAIVHLAGAMPAHVGITPLPYVKSIIEGAVNICEWMVKTNCNRIVFNTTPSDVAPYFVDANPVDDDVPRTFPKTGGDHDVYAICKNAAVDILEHYKIANGILPIVFRHMSVYSWHPRAYYEINGERRVIPFRQIIRKCIAGEPVEIWGDPSRKKELLYVDDFTEAIRMAIESKVTGLYNLPGFKPYTLEDQINGLIGAFCPPGKKSAVIYCPDKPSTPQNLLAGEKIQKALGWSPKVTWEEACIRMRNTSVKNEFGLMWGNTEDVDKYRG